MSTKDGFTQFKCDRAPKCHKGGVTPEEYLLPNDPNRKNWKTVSFIDSNGVVHNYTLCEECLHKYQSIMKTWDRDIKEFLEEHLYDRS